MKTMKTMKTLREIICEKTNRETLLDVAAHGANAGFAGWTYYSETVAFFEANRGLILERLKADADECELDPLGMVTGFGCLKSYKIGSFEIAEAIFGESEEWCNVVKNALAWYALECVAHEVANEAEEGGEL